jgi:hypothetical protein
VEWCWRRRQEVTGVATEEEAGRRGGDTQRLHGSSGSAELRVGNMSEFPSESLRSGVLVCPYHPHCREQHGVWQCVRLAYMSAEHKAAIDIARGVCLRCCEQEVLAEGACGRCGMSSTIVPEPVLPAARWSRPAWMLVEEAKEGQDFYECVAPSGVARRNPGPQEARIKEIAILFDYEAEHTLVYNRWLADMDL